MQVLQQENETLRAENDSLRAQLQAGPLRDPYRTPVQPHINGAGGAQSWSLISDDQDTPSPVSSAAPASGPVWQSPVLDQAQAADLDVDGQAENDQDSYCTQEDSVWDQDDTFGMVKDTRLKSLQQQLEALELVNDNLRAVVGVLAPEHDWIAQACGSSSDAPAAFAAAESLRAEFESLQNGHEVLQRGLLGQPSV